VNIKSSNNIRKIEKPEPELDPASIPLPESEDELEPEPVRLELKPEPVPEPEPYGIPGPSNTSELKSIEPISKEEMMDSIYKDAEKYWAKHGGDPDNFDWTCLTEEIKNRASGTCVKGPTNIWEALLDDAIVMPFRKWYNAINDHEESHVYPTNEEIAHILDKWEKIREIEFVPPPFGYKTVDIATSAMEEEESWSDDAEEGFYDQLGQLANGAY
jgi:hypothetical protein